MRSSTVVRSLAAFLLALAVIAGSAARSAAQIASDEASLEKILEELSTYDGGIDSAVFCRLRRHVHARLDSPAERHACETKLLEFLATGATPQAKLAASRMLRLIAGDRSVPVLEPMLLVEPTADMALYALQAIPGPAADAALLRALSATGGTTRLAIIAALGGRKNAGAVPALAGQLKSGGDSAPAAALALAEIGDEAACEALAASSAGTEAAIRPVVSTALLKCAERLLAARDPDSASAIYQGLLDDPSLAVPIRKAAMTGRIAAAGNRAAAMLLQQLQTTDPEMLEAAISMIVHVFEPEAIGPACSLLTRLPERAQVQLVSVLTAYPREMVLPALLQAARGGTEPVRIAALKALESAGDASATEFLAEAAARTRGTEQSAARSALAGIRGRSADEAVLELLAAKPPDDVLSELLLAVAERRLFSAKSDIARLLGSDSSKVRIQALKTLRIIGTPSDVPAVLDFMLDAGSDTERSEAETTAAALAQKIASPDGRANAVKTRLAREKNPGSRALLYGVLRRIGDDSALPLLRAALVGSNGDEVDAAVRALSGWPTPAARDDADLLARRSRDETHRLLALQGLIRMIGLQRYRKPEAAIAGLKEASRLARRPEEKKLILGLLPRFACKDALELARRFLRDRAVQAEARAAFDRIRTQLSN